MYCFMKRLAAVIVSLALILSLFSVSHAEDKKIELCHTLNGSALALPRIVAAIIENNQTPEGIRVPKALVPYCGFEMIDGNPF